MSFRCSVGVISISVGMLGTGCSADASIGGRGQEWHRLAGNAEATVLLDTTHITMLPNGEANVRLRYELGSPFEVATRPGAWISALEAEETTDCGRNTSLARSAILFDSSGTELGRTFAQPGETAPSMIGGAGGSLCRFLRARIASSKP